MNARSAGKLASEALQRQYRAHEIIRAWRAAGQTFAERTGVLYELAHDDLEILMADVEWRFSIASLLALSHPEFEKHVEDIERVRSTLYTAWESDSHLDDGQLAAEGVARRSARRARADAAARECCRHAVRAIAAGPRLH